MIASTPDILESCVGARHSKSILDSNIVGQQIVYGAQLAILLDYLGVFESYFQSNHNLWRRYI